MFAEHLPVFPDLGDRQCIGLRQPVQHQCELHLHITDCTCIEFFVHALKKAWVVLYEEGSLCLELYGRRHNSHVLQLYRGGIV